MLSVTWCILRVLYYVLRFVFVLAFLIVTATWWLLREALSPRGSEANPLEERGDGDGDEIQNR